MSPAPPEPAATQARAGPYTPAAALSEVERKGLSPVFNSEEFVDEAPATVYAKLLDEGIYLASVPTMYRVCENTTRCTSAAGRRRIGGQEEGLATASSPSAPTAARR